MKLEDYTLNSHVKMTPELLQRIISAGNNGSKLAHAVLDALSREGVLSGADGSYRSKRVKRNGLLVAIQLLKSDINGENEQIVELKDFVEGILGNIIWNQSWTYEDLGTFKQLLMVGRDLHSEIVSDYDGILSCWDSNNYDPFITEDAKGMYRYCSDISRMANARKYAEFFTKLAPAKIMVIKDEEGHIFARAAIYANARFCNSESTSDVIAEGPVAEIVGYSSSGALKVLLDELMLTGVVMIMNKDGAYNFNPILVHPENATGETLSRIADLRTIHVETDVKIDNDYTGTFPMLPSFSYIAYSVDKGMRLTSELGGDTIGMCTEDGPVYVRAHFCPSCGRMVYSRRLHEVCSTCKDTFPEVETIFGSFCSISPKEDPTYGRLPGYCFDGTGAVHPWIPAMVFISRMSR